MKKAKKNPVVPSSPAQFPVAAPAKAPKKTVAVPPPQDDPPGTGPTREEITLYAHLLWEEEGRPEGRSEAHWRQAEAHLTEMGKKGKG